MVIDPVLSGVIGALWLAVQGMAGLVYRELRQQIEDKDARIATLESEAREALRAKDEEIKEWKRLALGTRPVASP